MVLCLYVRCVCVDVKMSYSSRSRGVHARKSEPIPTQSWRTSANLMFSTPFCMLLCLFVCFCSVLLTFNSQFDFFLPPYDGEMLFRTFTSCRQCHRGINSLKIAFRSSAPPCPCLFVCWLVGLSAGLHKNYKITSTNLAGWRPPAQNRYHWLLVHIQKRDGSRDILPLTIISIIIIF